MLETTVDKRNLLTGAMPVWKVARDVTITSDDLTHLRMVI